jgi:Mn2+/Fe2+ NRAMP family transporter
VPSWSHDRGGTAATFPPLPGFSVQTSDEAIGLRLLQCLRDGRGRADMNSRGRIDRISGVIKSLGPGLVMAGTAIGGSHLVQSTRAGADYGFVLVPAVVAALVLKYPFMEFAPRYTTSTGESFLNGYRRVGAWAMWTFIAFTLCTMFFVTAAVTAVTAGLAENLVGLSMSVFAWRVVVIAVCLAILLGGGYGALDGLMKAFIVVLAVITLLAVAMVLWKVPPHRGVVPPLLSLGTLSMAVALMGWMPSILDVAVWYSLWALERREQTAHTPTLPEALFDFNLGYLDATLMAFAFVALGALIMFGSGISFSSNGTRFGEQLVELYTRTLGGWSSPIMSLAVFLTMFSSTLAVFDAYPRVLVNGLELIGRSAAGSRRRVYPAAICLLAAGVLAMFSVFQHEMAAMVDLATTLSFLTTPVLAYISYRVILLPNVPAEHSPSAWMRALSWAGIIFWSAFAALFVVVKVSRAGL